MRAVSKAEAVEADTKVRLHHAVASRLAHDHHRIDRAHTVCMLTVIQFLVIYGASAFVLSASITVLIFVRDAGMALFVDNQ
jgi:hypothetical protein